MDQRTDKEFREEIAGDPFHKGLKKHGSFKGFDPRSEHAAQRRAGDKVQAMTDDEVKASRSRLAKLFGNGNVALVLLYVGILGLMAKAYSV